MTRSEIDALTHALGTLARQCVDNFTIPVITIGQACAPRAGTFSLLAVSGLSDADSLRILRGIVASLEEQCAAAGTLPYDAPPQCDCGGKDGAQ